MGIHYNKDDESSFNVYVDANNLYGVSMSKKLPTGDFEWVEDPESVDVLKFDDGDIGYVLEVDVEYPKTLCNQHNELPFFR